MQTIRTVKKVFRGHSTSDGAGVRLRRIFGFGDTAMTDPFLLLDYFGSDNPNDYLAGFPWHPHRGIETVTYMLDGRVEHGDSLGNSGVIGSGDIQWMTAGSGIIHQEMPKSDGGSMFGFQLWVNLPASHKMMAPRYQEIKASAIPALKYENGIVVKVIAGEYGGVHGPVKDIVTNPEYLDISIPADTEFSVGVNPEHTVFIIAFEGEGNFGNGQPNLMKSGEGALMSDGDTVRVTTHDSRLRFLLIAGRPIGEPVAWKGPIVMNTAEELETAFREYREGRFVK